MDVTIRFLGVDLPYKSLISERLTQGEVHKNCQNRVSSLEKLPKVPKSLFGYF